MKIVCIAGYFDPINEGHLAHIEEAKKLGDILIAIVGTEKQCDNKPSHNGQHYHSFRGKIELLHKLGVDMVIPNIDNSQGSPCAETLRMIHPDIFAKGDDEKDEPIPETELNICREINCKIIYGVGKRLNRSSSYWQKVRNKS